MKNTKEYQEKCFGLFAAALGISETDNQDLYRELEQHLNKNSINEENHKDESRTKNISKIK
jgi:hypothetical protein